MIAIGGYTVLLPLHTATSMEIEISSVKMLYKHLIFCAVQRCRMSDALCRLSVKLTSFSRLALPLVRISGNFSLSLSLSIYIYMSVCLWKMRHLRVIQFGRRID
ncbi:hypothetical protein MTR67_028107 [Solanum verrucosum]|uniref:Uncharacterized protein n=1 Tax=Solanum verrucosum TaxID=315347 RepID=A0AAF0R1W4_SOLVR|nr:hypothetical protein MTR67_028107 [Solanum verrucosum]